MDFQTVKDLETFLLLTDSTTKELAIKLDVSQPTISSWMTNKIPVPAEKQNAFYELVYGSHIHLNKIKEQLYKEELSDGELLLFHGSKSGLEGPVNINRTRCNSDFGRGFYCGETLEQAAQFISSFESSSIYLVQFCPEHLIKQQYSVNQDWMLTIAYFRGRLKQFSNSTIINKLMEKVEKADYIVAPIADNRMYEIIDQFIDGEITDLQCQHCLSATNLGYQYVFKTDMALKHIRMLEKCYLTASEKKQYLRQRNEYSQIGQDKVKLAKRQYRNQGKYIEEILK